MVSGSWPSGFLPCCPSWDVGVGRSRVVSKGGRARCVSVDLQFTGLFHLITIWVAPILSAWLLPRWFRFTRPLGMLQAGSRVPCDFPSSSWIVATGMTGLIFYEPISSQIDWLWGLVTASFEDLECNFANALVPRFYPAVLSQGRSPFSKQKSLCSRKNFGYSTNTNSTNLLV